MKVKIIRKDFNSDVTIGKIYKVVGEYKKYYSIIGDSNGTLNVLKDDCEVINGHPHADLIMKYAEIAQYDAEPWKYFEADFGCGWVDVAVLTFHEAAEYRLKPRTININGFEVPEPLRSVPAYGMQYFIIDLPLVGSLTWTDSSDEYQWLKAGLIHLTREAAEKHLEALLSFTKERE